MRWPIALSFGGRSQLELFVCMDMTLEKDDSEKGEIPASDLTPQGTCLGCIFLFCRIMISRFCTDSLPGAVRERW